MRRDRRGEVGEGPHRRAQHHAVGARDRARRVRLDPVGEAQLPHPLQRLRGARVHHHLGREVAALARDAGDGAADQADADQRQAPEQRFSHARLPHELRQRRR